MENDKIEILTKGKVNIWVVRDILCPWENLRGKIIPCVFEKMEKMYIYRLKIQKRFIA